MRIAIAVCAVLIGASGALAQSQTQVRGHIRQDGAYVAPHVRTAPDSTRTNNWSSQPNINPYTGQAGRIDPYAAPRPATPPSYGGTGRRY
jgi:hypothetical protein